MGTGAKTGADGRCGSTGKRPAPGLSAFVPAALARGPAAGLAFRPYPFPMEAIPMKKILLGLLVVVVVGVLAVLGLAATKPDHYRVTRSATMPAPPAAVYSQIADMHKFPSWSPWQKLDPAMQVKYSGAESGVGAVYEWEGNKDAGAGRMTITEAAPDQKVVMKLEFLKPFASTAMTTLALTPEGEGTKVEWSMEGEYDFMSKVMCVFMDMDKMIGKDFTEGLANLGRVSGEAAAAPAETPAAADTSASVTASTATPQQ